MLTPVGTTRSPRVYGTSQLLLLLLLLLLILRLHIFGHYTCTSMTISIRQFVLYSLSCHVCADQQIIYFLRSMDES